MKKTAKFLRPVLFCLALVFFSATFAPAPGVAAQTMDPARGEITGLDFWKDRDGNMYVEFEGRDIPLPETAGEDESRMEALLPGFRTDPSLVRLYRLEEFEAGVRSLFVQNTQAGTRLVWIKDEGSQFDVSRSQDSLIYRFLQGEYSGTALQRTGTRSPESQFSTLSQEQQGLESGTLFPGMRTTYTGEPISIDLQNAEVEHVIRLITSITDYNLILDEDVRGRISLRLVNVPWDQALDLVQKNLGLVHVGDIIRITTAQKLEAQREQARKAREAEAQARESMQSLEPLEQEFIQINYSTAQEMLPQIRDFLSERGRVSHDSRTNTLIVRDTSSNLREVKKLIQNLDRPEKQVHIEARIVYATEEFRRGLGMKWQFMYPEQNAFSPSGYLLEEGVNFQSMNFPTMADDFVSIGGSLRNIAGTIFTLDAQLRLGETQRISRTVSSPSIVTLNNEQATIEQGLQIPYITLDEAGNAVTEFIPAILKLSVTPQITWDNNIIISLEVSDDNPVQGEDSVETRLARTKLFVENGETIVLGGIKKLTDDQTENRVPGLGNVPFLGWLFKNEFIEERMDELLIFIRPEIL
jgi:type IV pilus assembly protein PilQ